MRFKSAAWLAAFLIGAAPLFAQAGADGGSRYAALLDNIDLLIDNYSRYLGQKYELTDEQDAYTRKMLRDKTYKFLDLHEDNLRDVIEVMFEVRTGATIDDLELQAWGERVRPIYEDAKNIIVDANTDWREILSPAQREMHDEDLDLMLRSFDTTEEQLDRIIAGDMTVDEFRNPRRYRHRQIHDAERNADLVEGDPHVAQRAGVPEPPKAVPGSEPRIMSDAPGYDGTPRRGRRGPGARNEADPTPEIVEAPHDPQAGPPPQVRDGQVGQAGENAPATKDVRRGERGQRIAGVAGADYEGRWDKYVQDFIARYGLDDEQKQQANSILDDCKAQAARLVRGKVEQLDAREKELRSAGGNPAEQRAELAKLQEQKREALKPLDQIFEGRLKPRLDRLPTRAQRRTAEQQPQGQQSSGGAAGTP